jgi:uncharacterized protein (DUF924 family)/Ca2+-binding EF-hand superfamily protein
MEEALQKELIEYMFLRRGDGSLDISRCLKLWFGKKNETDIQIKNRYGKHVRIALQDGYESWKTTPRGCLALMILVDQFPRNIYRHTVHSFDGDRLARMIVDEPHDWLETLAPEECLFVPCLIMTHQENAADQEWGVNFYNKLEPKLPLELKVFRTIFEEHYRIIKLCGTFPHRDHYYGRKTSEVGRMLMENPKVRFDLPLIEENGVVKFGHDPKKLWVSTQRAFDALDRIEAIAAKTPLTAVISPASWLSEREIAECHQTFRAFDKDGNGSFDLEELATVLASVGQVYSKDKLQKVMDRLSGVKGSNNITFDKFSGLLRPRMGKTFAETVRRRFDMFDIDGSGEISLEELKTCIRSMDDLVTTTEIEQMFNACDIDGNGSISFEEFMTMATAVLVQNGSPIPC